MLITSGGDPTVSGSVITTIFNGFYTFLWFAFFVALCTSGVVAIVELSQQKRIPWAHRSLAIIGSILVVVQILNFLYVTFNVPQAYATAARLNPDMPQDQEAGIAGIIGIVFAVFVAMGIVPLAAAIKGFVRSSSSS